MKKHGIKNLKTECFLSAIKSTSKQLYETILCSGNQLQFIRSMNEKEFDFISMNNKLRLLIFYFDSVNRIGNQLSEHKEINIFQFSTFNQFAYNLLLGNFTNFNLPVLPKGDNLNIYNTSRFEICVAKSILKTHKRHEEYLESFINNKGFKNQTKRNDSFILFRLKLSHTAVVSFRLIL